MIHPFEKLGLGQAPFTCVSINDAGKVTGCCDACGTGIRWECHILSNDGKTFMVGNDCINKLDRDDNQLVTDVERKVYQFKLEQKRQASAIADAEWAVKVESDRQLERDRNGGLTDNELAEKKQTEAKIQNEIIFTEKNKWFIEALVSTNDRFCIDIANSLKRQSIDKVFYGNGLNICADIYAKTFGRRNSKKYEQAQSEFFNQRDLIWGC